ncbi:MAG: hypothetical protein ACP5L5_10455 [Vulcanisaeta sp.]|uniref:hypothetical protein n=1 Tax=Vulcanisaeta sp. TaxID=2020871 RepID=UPI003D0A84FB
MQSFFLNSWDIIRIVISNSGPLIVILLATVVLPTLVILALLLHAYKVIRGKSKVRVYRKSIIVAIVIFLVAAAIISALVVWGPLILLPGKYGYSVVNNTLVMYLPIGKFYVNLSEASVCVVNVTYAMRIEGFAYGPLGMGLFVINGNYMNVFFYAPEGLRWIYVIKYGHEVLGLYAPGLQLPVKCNDYAASSP